MLATGVGPAPACATSQMAQTPHGRGGGRGQQAGVADLPCSAADAALMAGGPPLLHRALHRWWQGSSCTEFPPPGSHLRR